MPLPVRLAAATLLALWPRTHLTRVGGVLRVIGHIGHSKAQVLQARGPAGVAAWPLLHGAERLLYECSSQVSCRPPLQMCSRSPRGQLAW